MLQQQNVWYQQAQRDLDIAGKSFSEINPKSGAAKNIILFVGYGMCIVTVSAARINDGQNKGQQGEEHFLSFEKFPFSGFSKTYNVDLQVPDSAGTMTAMMTGVKTVAGAINVNEQVKIGDCVSQRGNELMNFLELAELSGKATGIVTTTRLTHPTPAATYANVASRDWENDAHMPAQAKQHGCVDIARQFVEFKARLQTRFPHAKVDGLDVAMGGGRQNFLPKYQIYNSKDFKGDIEGQRMDKRHLINEWQQQFPDGVYVDNLQGFKTLTAKNQKVLGLFNPSHMQYQADRHNDVAGEPSLVT